MRDYPYTQDDIEQTALDKITDKIIDLYVKETDLLSDSQKGYVRLCIYDYLDIASKHQVVVAEGKVL